MATTKKKATAAYSLDDFHRAFAIALLQWQGVELSLFELLFLLLAGSERNFAQIGAVYYSQDSFGAKLKIVEAVAKVSLKGERAQTWKALKQKLGKAAQERNVLAHLTAAMEFHDDNSFDLALQPSRYVPKELRRNHQRKYDAKGCAELSEEFHELANAIDRFVTMTVPAKAS